nr:PsiF family protein [Pseudomonas aeruginosa]
MSRCLPAVGSAKAAPQQEKMKTCTADATAKALKGDERQAFMSSCLPAGGSAQAATQQEKMTTCNADATAKALKGDERKAFMSTCLKYWNRTASKSDT